MNRSPKTRARKGLGVSLAWLAATVAGCGAEGGTVELASTREALETTLLSEDFDDGLGQFWQGYGHCTTVSTNGDDALVSCPGNHTARASVVTRVDTRGVTDVNVSYRRIGNVNGQFESYGLACDAYDEYHGLFWSPDYHHWIPVAYTSSPDDTVVSFSLPPEAEGLANLYLSFFTNANAPNEGFQIDDVSVYANTGERLARDDFDYVQTGVLDRDLAGGAQIVPRPCSNDHGILLTSGGSENSSATFEFDATGYENLRLSFSATPDIHGNFPAGEGIRVLASSAGTFNLGRIFFSDSSSFQNSTEYGRYEVPLSWWAYGNSPIFFRIELDSDVPGLQSWIDDIQLIGDPVANPPAPQTPELSFRRAFLVDENDNEITSVQQGQAYSICYDVANDGADAGTFHVSGGGLGIPFNPSWTHYGLSSGNVERGCMYYPNTPEPGQWTVAIEVDPGNEIAEGNESDNTLLVPVQVI